MDNEKQWYEDYQVECVNPKAFDQTIQTMGALLHNDADGNYPKDKDGYYTMRVLANPGYVKFAIEHQGYGKVIGKIEAK